MAGKSKKQSAQAQARKRKRKADKRRKQKLKAVKLKATHGSVGKRHQSQLKRLIPNAWDGENPLDVAVFDDAVFEELADEQQGQVASVKTSLGLIASGKLGQATEAVSTISRKSELIDWRMLIRGLASWLTDDLAAAQTAWSRLDVDRRPARIAQALQLAHRDDLTELAAGLNDASNPAETDNESSAKPTADELKSSRELAPIPSLDRELIKAARVVRRMRIDRPAIKIASVGANQKIPFEDEIPETTLTSGKVQWLREFASDFQSFEPELVRALEIAALDRAMEQPYVDVFDEVAKVFRGREHDPRNLYRSFEYWSKHEGCEDKADDFLRRYVETDLPSNKELAEPLRNALLSSVWLMEAVFQVNERLAARSPFSFVFRGVGSDGPTDKTIRDNFQKAIQAYPANESAHQAYVDWIKQEVDDEDRTKKQREQATKRLIEAMKRWSKAIPNAAQPRTYLAQALLDAGEFEDAAPHIQWINNSRPQDPRLKILPWKSKLFEAMHLCRRKANLLKVPDVLAEAKSLWPSWLSPKWLPYFTAAWLLRSGDQAGFQKEREAINASGIVAVGSLADACMMLGAAQTMKVSAADLKPLRQPIDLAVKNVKRISTEDLLDAGSFFWEMHQTRVFYPAFRMHGSKFGRELLRRFKGDQGLLEKHIDAPEFKQSLFWFSEHRFWGDGY